MIRDSPAGGVFSSTPIPAPQYRGVVLVSELFDVSSRIVPVGERPAPVHILIPPAMLAALDQARGPRNRSEYVRRLIEADLQAAQGAVQP